MIDARIRGVYVEEYGDLLHLILDLCLYEYQN